MATRSSPVKGHTIDLTPATLPKSPSINILAGREWNTEGRRLEPQKQAEIAGFLECQHSLSHRAPAHMRDADPGIAEPSDNQFLDRPRADENIEEYVRPRCGIGLSPKCLAGQFRVLLQTERPVRIRR